MKRTVLLRFHKNLEVVQNRIDLLKYFNPNIPIYGLFGGEKNQFDQFKTGLKGLEAITYLDIADPDIKWRFSDNAILYWYRELGKSLDFDILHTIEHDLVLLDKLENFYPYKEGEKHIYITCLIELEKIKPHWNWFSHKDFPVEESKEFERLMKEEYGLTTLYGSMAPGTTLTKEYLEGYDKLSLPLIAHDEMRLPAIAQILKIEMKDTGFVRNWFDETGLDFRLFNCDEHPVDVNEMMEAYRTNYQKAFHPVYFEVEIETVKN